MSFYKFAPSPSIAVGEQAFATWENGFSESELSRIRQLGDSLSRSQATVSGRASIVEDIRRSEVSWIPQSDESGWLYDRLSWIARQLNGQFFDFDLFGFYEDFQYTVYKSGGDHYDFHMDKGVLSGGSPPRKLSLVVQLSEPSEYEGGDLEFLTGKESAKAAKKAGMVYAFPSWILHRVTPVTSGTRRSLVVWIAGPKFR